MSVYFTDEIEITNITVDATFRSETEGTPFLQEAYVEDEDKVRYDNTGQPLRSAKTIFVPYDTVISEGSLVRITKILGQTVSEKQNKVSAVNRKGMFKGDHLELIVGDRA
jgi:hypothetical protein